jgi:periplasmic divalent cation tolerance protein
VVDLSTREPEGILLAWVPCPDAQTARDIATAAVESRLAACGNILPGATSVYRWEGEVRCEPEALLVLKTTEARRAELTDLVTRIHPYELPAVSFLPVVSGHPPFLRWVASETVGDPG